MWNLKKDLSFENSFFLKFIIIIIKFIKICFIDFLKIINAF